MLQSRGQGGQRGTAVSPLHSSSYPPPPKVGILTLLQLDESCDLGVECLFSEILDLLLEARKTLLSSYQQLQNCIWLPESPQ